MKTRWISTAVATVFAAAAAGCTAQGASESTMSALETDKLALQQQLASRAPTLVVQAGQLAPPPQPRQPRDGTRRSRSAAG